MLLSNIVCTLQACFIPMNLGSWWLRLLQEPKKPRCLHSIHLVWLCSWPLESSWGAMLGGISFYSQELTGLTQEDCSPDGWLLGFWFAVWCVRVCVGKLPPWCKMLNRCLPEVSSACLVRWRPICLHREGRTEMSQMLFKILLWKKIFVFLFAVAELDPHLHQDENQKTKVRIFDLYAMLRKGSVSIKTSGADCIMARAWRSLLTSIWCRV